MNVNPDEEILLFRFKFIRGVFFLLSLIYFSWGFLKGSLWVPSFTYAYGLSAIAAVCYCLTYFSNNLLTWNRVYQSFVLLLLGINFLEFYKNPDVILALNLLSTMALSLTTYPLERNLFKISSASFVIFSIVFAFSNLNHEIKVFMVVSSGIVYGLAWFLLKVYYQAMNLLFKKHTQMQKRMLLEKAIFNAAEKVSSSNIIDFKEVLSSLAKELEIMDVGLFTLCEQEKKMKLLYSLQGEVRQDLNLSFVKPFIWKEGFEGKRYFNSLRYIKSLWLPVLSKDGEVLGQLFFACSKNQDWQEENLYSFQMIAQSLGAYLSRKNIENLVENSAKLSALGEIAAGIAHEINNPLAIIHGKANLIQLQLDDLKEGGQLDLGELQTNNKDIMETVDRVDKIVNSLRYFVRDDSKDPFISSSIDEILDNVQILSIDRCKKSNIKVLIEKPKEVLYLECKATKISQVLVNMVNNSFDALQELPAPKWIKIRVLDLGEFVQFEMIDSGLGIPKEVGDKILQAFYTTKQHSKSSGTGLGLNIVKRIIEMHQGNIAIDYDSPNTKFIIKIPKKQTLLNSGIKDSGGDHAA